MVSMAEKEEEGFSSTIGGVCYFMPVAFEDAEKCFDGRQTIGQGSIS